MIKVFASIYSMVLELKVVTELGERWISGFWGAGHFPFLDLGAGYKSVHFTTNISHMLMICVIFLCVGGISTKSFLNKWGCLWGAGLSEMSGETGYYWIS